MEREAQSHPQELFAKLARALENLGVMEDGGSKEMLLLRESKGRTASNSTVLCGTLDKKEKIKGQERGSRRRLTGL